LASFAARARRQQRKSQTAISSSRFPDNFVHRNVPGATELGEYSALNAAAGEIEIAARTATEGTSKRRLTRSAHTRARGKPQKIIAVRSAALLSAFTATFARSADARSRETSLPASIRAFFFFPPFHVASTGLCSLFSLSLSLDKLCALFLSLSALLSASSIVKEFKREIQVTSRLHAARFFSPTFAGQSSVGLSRRIGFIQKVSASHFSSRVLSTLLPPLLWSRTCEFNNVETAGRLAEKEPASRYINISNKQFRSNARSSFTNISARQPREATLKTLLGVSSLELT